MIAKIWVHASFSTDKSCMQLWALTFRVPIKGSIIQGHNIQGRIVLEAATVCMHVTSWYRTRRKYRRRCVWQAPAHTAACRSCNTPKHTPLKGNTKTTYCKVPQAPYISTFIYLPSSRAYSCLPFLRHRRQALRTRTDMYTNLKEIRYKEKEIVRIRRREERLKGEVMGKGKQEYKLRDCKTDNKGKKELLESRKETVIALKNRR